MRRALTPEGPVYFWWQGTCYATRADGGAIRRRPWPIRLPDGSFVRLADLYPIDLAIAGNVVAFEGTPSRYHEAGVAWRESPTSDVGPE
ncbi:MAG TPA: hypothetical protein VKR29_07280, partial [Candidatus Binataceae bacterium]|nr:hypothetical protein [Candidatus Binataceae bacterium]